MLTIFYLLFGFIGKLKSSMLFESPVLCVFNEKVINLFHNSQDITRPHGLLVPLTCVWHKQLTTLRATKIFVLIHSGIVNKYQLLCDAQTVLEPHRGTAAFFFFTYYRPFPLFLFMCLSLLTVLFLGASIVCVNNL